jgi:tetratricopeptide (TPR) repeat protein
VDHRSDIFSAGAVFYELSAYHPPVVGDNPMRILEELHSRASASLFCPDPAIPDDLGAVIERALRKNPDERFQDMAEMRAALESVRARLGEEATVLRRRIASRVAEVRELQGRFVEQAGGAPTYDTAPVTEQRMPVAVLETLGREYDRKLAHLQEQVEHASALRPRYEQAMEQLRLGQWTAAVEALERIVGEMPDHERAREGLTRARDEVQRAAEAARRQRAAAEHAQQVMEELRHRAERAASANVDEWWSMAEANREAGLAAFAEQGYAAAQGRFEVAAEQYRTAAEAIDRRVHELLRQARELLDERAFAACLPLAEEALTLVPGSEEATAVKLAAEHALTEEAERRAALERQCEDGQVRLAAGDFAGAIDALSRAVEEDPEHPRARQLLDEAQTRFAEEELRATHALADAQLAETVVLEEHTTWVTPQPAMPEPPKPEPTAAAAAMTQQPIPADLSETARAETRQEAAASVSAVQRAPRIWPAAPYRIRARALTWAVAVAVVLGLVAYWLAVPLMSSRRLQAEVEATQKHVQARREQAMTAEANILAREVFDSAAAKERDARRLTGERHFREAIAMLRDAAGRYEEAGRTSALLRDGRTRADQARARMLAEKGGATPGAAEFSEAVAREKEGDFRYQKLAFQEAADSFLAAAQLFTKAKVAPRATAEPDAQGEIREVLRLYSRVFEAKDLALLQRIRPRIRADELSRHRDVFEQTKSYRLSLKVETIKVNGDDADARGRREDIVVTRNGETLRNAGEFMFRLKRSNNQWTIDAVR